MKPNVLLLTLLLALGWSPFTPGVVEVQGDPLFFNSFSKNRPNSGGGGNKYFWDVFGIFGGKKTASSSSSSSSYNSNLISNSYGAPNKPSYEAPGLVNPIKPSYEAPGSVKPSYNPAKPSYEPPGPVKPSYEPPGKSD